MYFSLFLVVFSTLLGFPQSLGLAGVVCGGGLGCGAGIFISGGVLVWVAGLISGREGLSRKSGGLSFKWLGMLCSSKENCGNGLLYGGLKGRKDSVLLLLYRGEL